MVEGWALWADALALILFLAPRLQSMASAFGYTAPAWLVSAFNGIFAQLSQPLALLLTTWVLLQAVARAAIDEERQRPILSPEHVRDLQKQAAEFYRVVWQEDDDVYSFPLGIGGVLDTGSVLAGYYCQHFPKVAANIREWNDTVAKRRDALASLHERVESESTRSIEGASLSLGRMLNGVAMGLYSSPMEVVWSVGWTQLRTGLSWQNLVFQDDLASKPIPVVTIPETGLSLLFAKCIQGWLEEARNWPQSIEYRQAEDRLDALRADLSRQLEAARFNHSPGGRCDGCRPESG
jgi:hypothetical protein